VMLRSVNIGGSGGVGIGGCALALAISVNVETVKSRRRRILTGTIRFSRSPSCLAIPIMIYSLTEYAMPCPQAKSSVVRADS